MLHSSDDAIPSRLIDEALDRGLASRGALVRSGGVLVFGSGLSSGIPKPALREGSTPSLPNPDPAPDIDYVLKGRVDQISGQVQITVMLIDAKSRQYLWSDKFRRDFTPAAMIDLRQDIAVRVARAQAQSPGMIHTVATRVTAARYPASSSYGRLPDAFCGPATARGG